MRCAVCVLVAGAILAASAPPVAQEPVVIVPSVPQESTGPPGLDWPDPWISEVPLTDLSGSWKFDPRASDPMVEAWREGVVRYRIWQEASHVQMEFAPESGDPTHQVYRWGPTVSQFRRRDAEVRERSRWINGGRMLEVVGRWWTEGVRDDLHQYRLRYSISSGALVLEQVDPHGVTVWRFRRDRG